MKTYKPGNWGIHVIRLTFQDGAYKGHITHRTGGSACGATLLDTDFIDRLDEDQIEYLDENDCKLSTNFNDWADEAFYTAVLRDEEGNELPIKADVDELRNLLVSIEIVDYIPKENKPWSR